MSVSTAVGLVSSSLRQLLVGEMRLSLAVDVTILAPDEAAGDRRVNLFLYRVEENPYLRNMQASVRAADPSRLFPPPLSLNLSYLLTSYAPNDAQDGNATAHQLLGEAMRVMYENPVLPPRYLVTGLQVREPVQIVRQPLDPEELSRIWTTFSQPFRLSVLYQVSPVQLDQADARVTAAPARVESTGVPAMTQPPEPPELLEVTPRKIAASGQLSFTGRNLIGRHATIALGEQTLAQDLELTSDQFTVPVPAGVLPGVYRLQVDLPGPGGRTGTDLLVEVTP